MSKAGSRHPPVGTPPRKGQSGNSKSRPKSARRPSSSAFDMDRRLTVIQDGKPRECTVEEAITYETVRNAIAGGGAARNMVWKMVKKRDRWRAAHGVKHPRVQILIEPDPDNADVALLLLGIAELDGRWEAYYSPDKPRLLLRPEIVKQALARCPPPRSAKEISEIKRCTRDSETLCWPAGLENEQNG